MRSFCDSKDRVFKLKMTIGSAKSYSHRLDLIDAEASTIIELMATDMSMRLDMLWHFLENKEEVEDREDFENSLEGDVLLKADEALWGELAFFIQSLRPTMKEAVQTLILKYKEMTEKQAELVLSLAKSLDLEKAQSVLEKEAKEIMNQKQNQILKEFTE